MKKLLLLAISSLVAIGAHAQGTLNFATLGGGGGGLVQALTRDGTAGNALATGAAYAAMLYCGPASALPSELSTNGVSGAPAPFNVGGQAGYFTGGARIITGFAPGATVTLQIRAWATASGNSWEAASIKGESVAFQFVLGSGPPATPPNLTPLHGTAITLVPEPSSIALGLLGLGALALIRRRK